MIQIVQKTVCDGNGTQFSLVGDESIYNFSFATGHECDSIPLRLVSGNDRAVHPNDWPRYVAPCDRYLLTGNSGHPDANV